MQLTATTSVMVDAEADAAGGRTLIIGVDDVDAVVSELGRREIVA